jgi:RNA polymerase sigma factor (sigma-70 family)
MLGMKGAAARLVLPDADATEGHSRPVDGTRRAACDDARERFRVAARADLPGRRGDGQEAGWFAAAAVALRRYVARRVSNSTDAEDIAQQAVLLAWEERSAAGAAHSPGWLAAIARHLIIDYQRERSRKPLADLAAPLVERESSPLTQPEMAAVVVEGRERLRALLGANAARLCLEHQVALLLAEFYGHRDRHSAAVLGMSLPSFRQLLHRARARMRQLQERGPVAVAPQKRWPRGNDLQLEVAASGQEVSRSQEVLHHQSIAVR